MRIKKILHNKILVLREKPPEMVGIFHMPQTVAKKEIGIGLVIEGNKEIRPNTRIYFNKFAGSDIDLGDKNDLVILDPRDIIAEVVTYEDRTEN
jgi:co-chaperonin GroES (HSP10)